MPRWTRISAGPSTQTAPPIAPATAIAAIASGRGTPPTCVPVQAAAIAREQLALGADVPEAGAERDRDGGAGEEERRRRDEHLQPGEAGVSGSTMKAS